jgi:hypothetical protein
MQVVAMTPLIRSRTLALRNRNNTNGPDKLWRDWIPTEYTWRFMVRGAKHLKQLKLLSPLRTVRRCLQVWVQYHGSVRLDCVGVPRPNGQESLRVVSDLTASLSCQPAILRWTLHSIWCSVHVFEHSRSCGVFPMHSCGMRASRYFITHAFTLSPRMDTVNTVPTLTPCTNMKLKTRIRPPCRVTHTP